jgi:hypothetical protein
MNDEIAGQESSRPMTINLPIDSDKRARMLESLCSKYIRSSITVFQKDGFNDKELLEAFQKEIAAMLGDYGIEPSVSVCVEHGDEPTFWDRAIR